MSKNRPIHYEPHPVSRERKAQLVAQGLRIIDAKFRPKDQTPAPPAALARAELDQALASLPGEYSDAEYVVNGMRGHFGELFTPDDEATVRALVKVPSTSTEPAAEVVAADPPAAEQAPAKPALKQKAKA
jgi:hypothetical protein